MNSSYEQKYHANLHNRLLENPTYYLFRAKYAEKVYWQYLPKAGPFLEFGSGIGQNIFLHAKASIGLDISKFARDECRKRGIRTVGRFKEIKNKSINAVLSIHSLEHVDDPNKVIREIYRILKKSGIFLLVLPAEKHELLPIKKIIEHPSQHLFAWNFTTIDTLLVRNKFKIKLNKFNYAYGFSMSYKLPFSLASVLVRLLGRIKKRGSGDLLIVAEK
jgi:ubiquinone/menaquinone biosynthesis C-methylase UbiE